MLWPSFLFLNVAFERKKTGVLGEKLSKNKGGHLNSADIVKPRRTTITWGSSIQALEVPKLAGLAERGCALAFIKHTLSKISHYFLMFQGFFFISGVEVVSRQIHVALWDGKHVSVNPCATAV